MWCGMGVNVWGGFGAWGRLVGVLCAGGVGVGRILGSVV